MLSLGVLAQMAGTFVISIPVFLIPRFHLELGLGLEEAGAYATAPTIGLVLTLVLWGAAADKWGERGVIVGGLVLTGVFSAVAMIVTPGFLYAVVLVLCGASAASANSASGRVVIGWFPRERAGLAMGIRQISQPLGVALAALTVPGIANMGGDAAPFAVGAVLCAVLAIACLLGIKNPQRKSSGVQQKSENPYRRSSFLARIHAMSVLLVIPQFTLATFGLVWLVADLSWNEAAAGGVVAASQIVGSAGRIVIGIFSDAVGSRVRVLRWVSIGGVATMLLLAAVAAWGNPGLAAVCFIIAATVSVADNGLAFSAVAEAAGGAWAGRAFGVQNTGQYVAAAAVGPGMGAIIALVGFPITFAIVAVAPLAAYPLAPARDERPATEQR